MYTAIIVAVVIIAGALFVFYQAPIRQFITILSGTGGQDDDKVNAISQSTIIIGSWVVGFGVVGLIAMAFWSFSQETIGWQTFATTVLVGIASAAVGALLGFIFGIPRTLDPASRIAVAGAMAQGGPVASSQAALAANTNLERVSDWLTTVLIGITLVQSQSVITWIWSLGDKFKDGIKIQVLVPIIVVYYFALAFLGTYLITRLYLTYALQQSLAFLTGAAGPQISAVTMPQGQPGTVYPLTAITASGGTPPYKWTALRLPQGLGIDPVTGVISGTPTVAAAKEKYTVVVIDSATPPNADAAQLEIEVG
jgi:Putative Ig domain